MERTILNIVLILIFTKIGGMISRKFKMPEVLGALVAGVILGPIVLNLIEYNSEIKLLANLGVIMLMFLAGLETDLKEFKKVGFSALMIAIGGILVPLIFGTLSAYLFFTNFWENLFIGVILTATSVSITVETLKELGKLNTKAGANILGAAVIDDILGLILISIVLALSESQSAGSGSDGLYSILLVLGKIGIFCVIVVVGIVFLPKLINKIAEHNKAKRELLAFAIAASLLMAYVAESLGIAGITGAYICGLIFSTLIHKENLERNVKAISSGFLALIFFASIGLEANLDGISIEMVYITTVMFLIAVFGKFIGCGCAARLLKISRRESVQIGTGMISRGEVAIITANIGLQHGIITEEVFLPTLIVVILTTIVTPVLLKIAFTHKVEKKVDKKILEHS